ncbi:MAG: type I-U CRISPR-associated protein Csx17, partial [Nitrososphaera sp.]
MRFFLNAYRPSPIVAPWNSDSGFWGRKAASQTLARLEASSNPRLALYRQVIQVARQVLAGMGLQEVPKDAEKARLLRRLRARLPDEAIAWLDAAAVLVDGDPRYAPLLGSGGNDGRLDFTANFIQHLERVLPLGGDTGDARGRRGRRGGGHGPGQSRAWLEDALFATGAPPLADATPGQYHPGAVRGPNLTRGMEGRSLANPWDFVLMMEGALAFAGAVARRLGVAEGGRASFPFTVDAVPVGTGTAAEGEVADARGEIWVPLWEQPATYAAVAYLLAEGRAQAGRRQAKSGLDFARAAASLGVDRGVGAFYRYGLLCRNGKAYLATPLGRIRVQARPHMHLIGELEPWLDRWRLFCKASETPERYRRAFRALEAAIFAYCQDGGPAALQRVLAAAGRAEQALAAGRKEE